MSPSGARSGQRSGAGLTAIGYITSFPSTESSMSEGGLWRNGLTHGLDWTDVATTAGKAYGTQTGGSGGGPPYNDSIACLSGFPPNHGASQTILVNAGGDTGTFHEAEILLRWDISANVARGYECLYAWDGAYCEIVAWNGALNNFTPRVTGTPTGALVTGDILMATAVGNVITLYRNGAQVAQYTDTSNAGGAQWTSGNPGIGFWRRGGTSIPARLQASHYEAFAL